MNHYVYEITYQSGMKYIGARSCKCAPIEDTKYLGSSKIIPAEDYRNCVKQILQEFNSRPEAIDYEVHLHKLYNVKDNLIFYNQVNQTSTKFDQQGCTAKTHKHIQDMVVKRTGRTKETHKYLEDQSIKQRQGRSLAQIASYKAKKGVSQGPNAAKALKGANSPFTKPWYYITPDFNYVEVHNSVPGFFRDTQNIPKNMNERATKYAVSQSAHTPVIKGKMKGFTIGRLNTKPDYLTQNNISLLLQLVGHLNVNILKGIHTATKMGNKSIQKDHYTGRFS